MTEMASISIDLMLTQQRYHVSVRCTFVCCAIQRFRGPAAGVRKLMAETLNCHELQFVDLISKRNRALAQRVLLNFKNISVPGIFSNPLM
jgi:hypothetical protein